jgi:hypothetical protein
MSDVIKVEIVKHNGGYSFELMTAVCEKIANGDTVSSAVEGIWKRSAFYSFVKKYPEAAELYHEARLARADWCRDKIAEIAKRLQDGEIDPASAKVAADNIRWLASKDAPAAYSDRVEMTGAKGVPLFEEMSHFETARGVAYLLRMGEREMQEALETEKKRQ